MSATLSFDPLAAGNSRASENSSVQYVKTREVKTCFPCENECEKWIFFVAAPNH